MGKPWITFFGDKTKDELEKELTKVEKKMANLDKQRIDLKIAIALHEHETSVEG